MKASTTLLLFIGSISLSEAVKIEQLHQQTAPNLNELVSLQSERPKKNGVRKTMLLATDEMEAKFSAKDELHKKAQAAHLGQMEDALSAASKQVHEQAEQEETANKAAVRTSALSQLKEKQMQEERQLKAAIATEENKRMKELREGEEYARKVEQAEVERASQELLAQERAKQMKELQEIEAEQRKDADREEQEFLTAQAMQETKALGAKKAAQKAKIARMKRKHELERHNAEAKLQLFKMEQQEESEKALSLQQATLEAGEVEKEASPATDNVQNMLNKGRQLSGTSAPGNKGAAAVGAKPSDPDVDGLVKKGQATKDPMEEENAKAKKEGEALKVKPESNTKKVLARGLKQKKGEIKNIQKDLNDTYKQEQADLSNYEKNQAKTPVRRDVEIRAKQLEALNKREKFADQLSNQEAETTKADTKSNKPAAKPQAASVPLKINQTGAKKTDKLYEETTAKSEVDSKINDILKSKNEKEVAPAAAVVASKEMIANQVKMENINQADKEKTQQLKGNLKKELAMFSVSLAEKHYDNAIKIKQELSELGEEASFDINTDEIYKSSFTFPQIANNDFAQEMLGQLQATQSLFNQSPDNEISKEQFVSKALYVQEQLKGKYQDQWINPRDEQEPVVSVSQQEDQ